MWTCPNCSRIFDKTNQPHSCRKVPLEQHFEHKPRAKKIFDLLYANINREIGHCQIVSLPCCVHLFGHYDFLAVLPKRETLEIRFALDRQIDGPRLKQAVPMSARVTKNCIDVGAAAEIDRELICWLAEAYHLKDKV